MKLIFMCTKCANTSPCPPTQPFARGDEWHAADASVPDVCPAGVRTDGCNSARCDLTSHCLGNTWRARPIELACNCGSPRVLFAYHGVLVTCH
jgi:hypothetical protein